MNPADPSAASPPVVHALLACRRAEAAETGEISLHNVLEVLSVESLPGDVGPITFVALVRNLPPGPGTGAFLLRPAGNEQPQARLPLRVRIPPGFEGRQVALEVSLKSLPVKTGGWFEVEFEWAGEVLAGNRFAVGVKG